MGDRIVEALTGGSSIRGDWAIPPACTGEFNAWAVTIGGGGAARAPELNMEDPCPG